MKQKQLALRNLRIEILSTMLGGLGTGMIVPFLAVMALKYGGDALDTAVIAAAPAAANLLALLWGRMTQNYDRVRLMSLLYGSARIFILFMAFTTQSSILVLLTVMFYVMLSIAMPSYVGLMRTIYPEAKRASYMAYVRISGGIAVMAGTYTGGHWLDGRFRLAVLISCGLGIAGMAVFSRIREPIAGREEDEQGGSSLKDSVAAIKLDGAFQLLLLGVFIYEFVQLLPASIYPIFQLNHLGLSFGQIGLLSIVMTAAALLFNPIWGDIIDKRSSSSVLFICAMLGAFYPLVYWLVPHPFAIICASFAAGVAGAGMDLAWIGFISRTAGRHITSYSGVYLTLVGVRGILAPLLGAIAARRFGMDSVIALSFSFTLLSLIPFFLLIKRERYI
ncbi:MFS transporter [Cohnella lubricantis]|uniref:MFS transporter n=1 Tax=Cohnella lubricantis TaxID=2163172 RepID=A0A841T3Y6_9BACL|nr:MFS transporter [Cohnella lubricantis]MBB6676054.1 MFS transporter [Cohnella lubricantis]MBP2118009.1 MFS family permease [Cohnella lubricantis]